MSSQLSTRRQLTAAIDAAIRSGTAFMQRRLEARTDQRWLDFPAGAVSPGSTEWVSALVCAQLGRIPEARHVSAAVCADLLRRSRPSGGWGYRDSVWEDCDSTAWVLLAAESNGVILDSELKRRSLEFISAHQAPNGGFRTYGDWVRPHLQAEQRAGWFEPEVSVTGAAVMALAQAGLAESNMVRNACAYLLSAHVDSSWGSYWWGGQAYTVYCVLRALTRAAGDSQHVQALSTQYARECWTAMRRSPDVSTVPGTEPPNCHAISLALLTWRLCEPSESLADAERELSSTVWALLHAQQESGGFPAATELVVPGGLEGNTLRLLDTGVVTSAWTLNALHEARNVLGRLSETEVSGNAHGRRYARREPIHT